MGPPAAKPNQVARRVQVCREELRGTFKIDWSSLSEARLAFCSPSAPGHVANRRGSQRAPHRFCGEPGKAVAGCSPSSYRDPGRRALARCSQLQLCHRGMSKGLPVAASPPAPLSHDTGYGLGIFLYRFPFFPFLREPLHK